MPKGIETIREEILKLIEPSLSALSLSLNEVDEDSSLLDQGIMDSLSFLSFITNVEDQFNIEFDFGELDPSEFTSISQIISLIHKESKTNDATDA